VGIGPALAAHPDLKHLGWQPERQWPEDAGMIMRLPLATSPLLPRHRRRYEGGESVQPQDQQSAPLQHPD